MATQRFLTPAGASGTVLASFGMGDVLRRNYSATAPGFADVTLGDNLASPGNEATVNGAKVPWTACGVGSGTTAQRPAPGGVAAGSFYVDTTLGYTVCFDGTAWRNPITGAVV